MVHSELQGGPSRRQLRNWIELVDVDLTNAGEIVIADKDWIRKQVHHLVEAFAWTGPVANCIAQVPDSVIFSGVRENRLERHEVCVNVR